MVQLDDRFSVSQLAFTRARVQRVTAEVRHTGTQAGGQDGKVGRQVGRQVGRWNVGIFASNIRGRGISGFAFLVLEGCGEGALRVYSEGEIGVVAFRRGAERSGAERSGLKKSNGRTRAELAHGASRSNPIQLEHAG